MFFFSHFMCKTRDNFSDMKNCFECETVTPYFGDVVYVVIFQLQCWRTWYILWPQPDRL